MNLGCLRAAGVRHDNNPVSNDANETPSNHSRRPPPTRHTAINVFRATDLMGADTGLDKRGGGQRTFARDSTVVPTPSLTARQRRCWRLGKCSVSCLPQPCIEISCLGSSPVWSIVIVRVHVRQVGHGPPVPSPSFWGRADWWGSLLFIFPLPPNSTFTRVWDGISPRPLSRVQHDDEWHGLCFRTNPSFVKIQTNSSAVGIHSHLFIRVVPYVP